VGGGDGDEAPRLGAREVLPAVACEQERAREQQVDQPVPAVLRELADRRDVLEAGVGHDRVEAPEALDRGLDRAPVALAGGEVGGVGDPGAVGIGLEVHGEHLGPGVDEPLRDRAADPARGARDDDRGPLHRRGV